MITRQEEPRTSRRPLVLVQAPAREYKIDGSPNRALQFPIQNHSLFKCPALPVGFGPRIRSSLQCGNDTLPVHICLRTNTRCRLELYTMSLSPNSWTGEFYLAISTDALCRRHNLV